MSIFCLRQESGCGATTGLCRPRSSHSRFRATAQRIAAAGINGAVALIDRKTRNVARTLVGPGMPVWSVAFLPDGRTLLTGGGDRAIRRWDAETGEPLDPPERGPEDPLAAYAGESGARGVSRLRGLPYAGTRRRQSRRPELARHLRAADRHACPATIFPTALKQLDIVWTPETVAKLFEIGPAALHARHQNAGADASARATTATRSSIFSRQATNADQASSCLRLALAQIIVGGAQLRPRRRAMRIEVFLRDDDDAAIVAHLDESRRCGALWYIQCLPSSLARMRSIVLLTPNGLPQRMQ